MKRILLILIAVTMFAACEKDSKGRLNPGAKMKITGVQSIKKSIAVSSESEGIRGTGITDSLNYITRYVFRADAYIISAQTPGGAFGFGGEEPEYSQKRDTINNKLFYSGYGVVNDDGSLGDYLMGIRDIVFVSFIDKVTGKAVHPKKYFTYDLKNDCIRDTIAYIPNNVILKAREEASAALAREDYAEVYRIFDQSYVFIPTTGPKWRAMKAAGIE